MSSPKTSAFFLRLETCRERRQERMLVTRFKTQKTSGGGAIARTENDQSELIC